MKNKFRQYANHSNRLIRLCCWVSASEWLFLLLIIPLVLFPSPIKALSLLLLPLLWTARKIGRGHFVPATPVDWIMFGLLLMILVSLYATFDINFSLDKIAGLTYGIVVFYATVAWVGQSSRRIWQGVGLLFVLGWGVAILSLLGAKWLNRFPVLDGVIGLLPQRLVSLPGAVDGISTNQLAGVLLWIAPLALMLTVISLARIRVLWRQLRPYQIILILLFAAGTTLLTGGILFLTQSRGGLLGFVAGLLFMAMAVVASKSRHLLVGIFILAILGTAVLLTTTSLESLTALLFDQVGLDIEAAQIETLNGRMEIWSRALYAMQDFPFTGVGMNNFRRIVPILYPLFLISPEVDIAHAHNHLLQTALDLGLPGLVAYVALWLAMGMMLWQTWHQAHSIWMRGLTLGFAGALCSYSVYGLTDTVALGAKPGFIFWIMVGLITASYKLIQAQQRPL